MFTPVPPNENEQKEDTRQRSDEHSRPRVATRLVFFAIIWGSLLGLCFAFPLTLAAHTLAANEFRFRESGETVLGTLIRTYTFFTPALIFLVGLALVGEVIIEYMIYTSGQTARQVQRLSRWLRKSKQMDLPKATEPSEKAETPRF